jgi:hypothetical protein
MADPRSLTRGQAEELLRRHVDGETGRLQRFEIELRKAGIEPDYTRASLGPAGTFVRDRLRPRPTSEGSPFGHLGEEGRELLDGLAAYFAACVRRLHPALHWQLDTDPRSSFFQRPILAGVADFELFPPTPVATKLLAAWSTAPPDDAWLIDLFDRWASRLDGNRERPDQQAARNIAEDVDVLSIDGDPEWDIEIWIPDDAEYVLGAAEFHRLPQKLEAIDGIDRLAWEDRERFIARIRSDADVSSIRNEVMRILERRNANDNGDESH